MLTLLKWTVGLLILATLVLLVNWYFKRSDTPKPSTSPIQSTFRTQVIEKLRAVNELHTGIAIVQTIVTNSQGKRVLGVEIGTTKLLYVAVGQVRAGIDLAKLTAESIVVENERVCLRLPPPEILDSKIDVENSYVYDVRKSMMLAPDAFNLQSDAQRKALDEVTTAAIRCGILEMASEQAKTVLYALLSMMGFEKVSVEVNIPAQEVAEG